MKGISPVIATVLLLLMAVAAVGGAWVWYQRQSALVGGKTEEKISEQIEQQTGVAIALAGIYKDASDNLHLLITNAGTSNVTVTSALIEGPDGKEYITLSNCNVGAQGTADCTTGKAYTTYCNSADEQLSIKLFAAGIATQEYIEDCPV